MQTDTPPPPAPDKPRPSILLTIIVLLALWSIIHAAWPKRDPEKDSGAWRTNPQILQAIRESNELDAAYLAAQKAKAQP